MQMKQLVAEEAAAAKRNLQMKQTGKTGNAGKK